MEDEFDKFIMEMEGLKMVMEGKKTENKRHKVGICKNAHKVVSI